MTRIELSRDSEAADLKRFVDELGLHARRDGTVVEILDASDAIGNTVTAWAGGVARTTRSDRARGRCSRAPAASRLSGTRSAPIGGCPAQASRTPILRADRMTLGEPGERPRDVQRREHADRPRGSGLDHDQVREVVLDHEPRAAREVV